MPKSMTGFGSGEVTCPTKKIKVEIRAVNKRDNSADIAIKMPALLDPFENNIRRRLLRDITRGIIHVTINIEHFAEGQVMPEVDFEVADALVEGLRLLGSRYGCSEVDGEAILNFLAARADIFKPAGKKELSVEEGDIFEPLDMAVAALSLSREKEGAATAADIQSKISNLYTLVANIEERLPIVEKEQSEKILERIDEIADRFNETPDVAILVSEVGLFVNRRCINEEIVRIKNHLQQMQNLLACDKAVGRELEFLVKELKRETHTISAKAIDTFITSQIIEVKVLAEKIYEQVLNIE